MSREEKITLVVLLLTIALWITERMHGLSEGVVAVTSMCVLLGFNIFDREDFRGGIDWPAIIFIGSVNNLGTVVQALGIDKYIGHALESSITAYMSNVYLFIVLLVAVMVMTRFVIVSITAAVVVFALVLVPLAAAHGINPWIIAVVVFASTNTWFAFYQNSTYLCAFYATGGEMVKHRQMVRLAAIYVAVSTLGLLLSVPYWRLLGLIR
jgi:DASS family divalent anion:Na+ symporter